MNNDNAAIGAISLNAKYLLLFFKQLEHALHVDEGILDHSAKRKMTCSYHGLIHD